MDVLDDNHVLTENTPFNNPYPYDLTEWMFQFPLTNPLQTICGILCGEAREETGGRGCITEGHNLFK